MDNARELEIHLYLGRPRAFMDIVLFQLGYKEDRVPLGRYPQTHRTLGRGMEKTDGVIDLVVVQDEQTLQLPALQFCLNGSTLRR